MTLFSKRGWKRSAVLGDVLLLTTAAFAVSCCSESVKNLEKGMVPSYPFDETASLQRRIDEVAAQGGGRVVIGTGVHSTGQLDLRSNVDLHLERGAVLKGLPGLANYRVTAFPYSEGTWSAIVFAYGVTNVSVTGEGVIDGDGTAWPQPQGGDNEGLRARGLFFGDSKGVRLEDFTLRDSACWGCVFKCCDDVVVRRVKIDSHANANNDGFDIEAKNVLIEDCDVDSGDDAYCLKSNDPRFVVENVRIRNCVARSHCNGFKIGTATHGTIRNVRFERCRAEAPRRDFRETRSYRPNFGKGYFYRPGYPSLPFGVGLGAITIENVDGGCVEEIVARDIEISGFQCPIFIRAGRRTGRSCGTPPSDICVFRNIRIENIRGKAEGEIPSSVTGVNGCRVKDVTFCNVDITCRPADPVRAKEALETPVPDVADRYPECTMFRPHILPAYGLYVDKADNVRLENVKFSLPPGQHDLRPSVFHCPGVAIGAERLVVERPMGAIRVGSYNIRLSGECSAKVDGENRWELRKADVVALVRDMKLDVFGMQEVCPDQADYLRHELPEFAFVGDHRGADRKSDEASPVFYRRDRFAMEKGGTFWLSETPEVPASKSWGTCCTRVCSYLVLKDKRTSKRFCFANTHTDHVSELAREKGMLLIVKRMKDFGKGAPIIFTGDHNNTEIEKPAKSVAHVLHNALYLAETPPRGPWRTWNGWRWKATEVTMEEALSLPMNVRNIANNDMERAWRAAESGVADDAQKFFCRCSGPRIDYIWVSDGVRVLDYETVNRTRLALELYPSDHFPVVASIVLPEGGKE